MEEIKIVLQGYNEEKIQILKIISEIGNYNAYNKERVEDLKKRRETIDLKIKEITDQLLTSVKL